MAVSRLQRLAYCMKLQQPSITPSCLAVKIFCSCESRCMYNVRHLAARGRLGPRVRAIMPGKIENIRRQMHCCTVPGFQPLTFSLQGEIHLACVWRDRITRSCFKPYTASEREAVWIADDTSKRSMTKRGSSAKLASTALNLRAKRIAI